MFLTHGEVAAFARAAEGSGDFIRFLAYTGLHFGEATALRVHAVDLDRRRLDVARAFSDVSGLLIEELPKAHQHRSVPIVPLLMPALSARVDRKGGDDLVFTVEGGAAPRLPN